MYALATMVGACQQQLPLTAQDAPSCQELNLSMGGSRFRDIGRGKLKMLNHVRS